jgi:hypothetical protein
MSPRESKRRERQRRRDRKNTKSATPKKTPKPRVPEANPAFHNDAQVLTFLQWCSLNNLSERTGRRILAGGSGPVITDLSAQRIGITVRANRAWQDSRARA